MAILKFHFDKDLVNGDSDILANYKHLNEGEICVCENQLNTLVFCVKHVYALRHAKFDSTSAQNFKFVPGKTYFTMSLKGNATVTSFYNQRDSMDAEYVTKCVAVLILVN